MEINKIYHGGEQELLNGEKPKETVTLSKPYDKGSRNYTWKDEKKDTEYQVIRITEGCPNNCEYCAETKENGKNPIYYNIPKITHNKVKILDMNLTSKPKAIEIIKELGSKKTNGKVIHYELVCGIDYRYMTQELANTLKENRFINIRLAWDYGFNLQKKIKSVINMLIKTGYKPKDIMVFMICNWKISFNDCMHKLDLCKIWNVQVCDCWFDNQIRGQVKPIHWIPEQIHYFGKRCRKHNQEVNYGIDPEYNKKTK